MDTEKSLDYVNDFERRIERAPNSPDDEKFVRNFVARVANTSPLPVVLKVAIRVLEIRKAELQEAGTTN
jgi:hypothetical protein